MPLILSIPIDETIAQTMESRLLTCNAVSEVVRVSKRDNEWIPKDKQVLLTKTSPIRFTAIDCLGNPCAIGWQVTFNIYCHVLQSVHETEPVEGALSNIASEVIKTITEPSSWYQFDGVAIDANIGDIRRTTQNTFDVWPVTVGVRYRSSETNPFEVR